MASFFCHDAKFNLPVYQEEEILNLSSQYTEDRGIDHNILLNDLLGEKFLQNNLSRNL
jgi:hypothetical protein